MKYTLNSKEINKVFDLIREWGDLHYEFGRSKTNFEKFKKNSNKLSKQMIDILILGKEVK